MRAAISFIVLVLASMAGGCANGNLSLDGAQSLAAAEAPAGDATPDDKPAFQPFKDQYSAAVGGREVIKNPTDAEIMAPGGLPEMVLGRPDAPVTIIKYASLTCPYCRKFQLDDFPILKREYIDTGKVRYILREFPIGFQSGAATIALRCAPPEKYFALYDKFMAQQNAWVSQEVRTDPIFRIAAQVGVTSAQFDACRANRAMIAALNQVKERGRTLGIIGTPNFFINGQLVKKVVGMTEIRAMIDPVLAGRVAAN